MARATSLLIVADSGGRNGSRVRRWRWELPRFANESHPHLHVSHLPPEASMWNEIDHRPCSISSRIGRDQPLVALAAIVKPGSGRPASAVLTVRCVLDRG